MHGFVLTDAAQRPSTAYIGWRDSRAATSSAGESSTLDVLNARIGARYSSITGMNLRAGIPYVNVACLRSRGQLSAGSSLLAMPDWIAASLGRWEGRTHVTMAAASGFLDLERRKWSEELLEGIEIDSGVLRFPEIVEDERTALGKAELDGHSVPIYGGGGDLQCSVSSGVGAGAADACV